MPQLDIIHGDRRTDRRYAYPLEMRFTYRDHQGEHAGNGCTVDLSHGGIRFQTDTTPPVGVSVELQVAWPFLLHNVCPLELRIWGSVLRNDGRGTVVSMKRYEFRTCGERSFHHEAKAVGSIMNFVA